MSDIRFTNLGELFSAPVYERRERNFAGVGKAIDNLIREQQEEKERLRLQKIEDEKRKLEEADRKARFKTVADLLDGDDTEMKVAAQRYVQTGDNSGFSQVAMNRALNAEKKKEAEASADVAYLNDLAELMQLDKEAIDTKTLNDPTYKSRREALMRRATLNFEKLSNDLKTAEGGEQSDTLEALRKAGEEKAKSNVGTISNEDLEAGRFGTIADLSKAYDVAVANNDDDYRKRLQEAFVVRLGNEGKLRKDGKTPEEDRMSDEEKEMAKKFGMLRTASKSRDDYAAKLAKAKEDFKKLKSPNARKLFKSQAAKKYGINEKDVEGLGND